MCILEKEKLLLKVITKPPDVWMAYFQLTNPILDDKIKLDFSNGYKNLIVKIPKPQKGKADCRFLISAFQFKKNFNS